MRLKIVVSFFISFLVTLASEAAFATVRSTGPRSFELDVCDVKPQATTDGDGRLMRLTVPDAKVVIER